MHKQRAAQRRRSENDKGERGEHERGLVNESERRKDAK